MSRSVFAKKYPALFQVAAAIKINSHNRRKRENDQRQSGVKKSEPSK